MAKEHSSMTARKKSKPVWPADKPIPQFRDYAEELRFWERYDFEDGPAAQWEEVRFTPPRPRHSRRHVYRIRFDDREIAALRDLAQRRGMDASDVVRELILEAERKAG
jgi:hypothetical protein